MIQITATVVETNSQMVTAYLSPVQREGNDEGWRLIWIENGQQKKSRIKWFPRGTSVLQILVACYTDPDTEGVAL